MRIFYQFAIFILFAGISYASHKCTLFNDKNHGFGCELRNVTPSQNDFEINIMARDDTNKTEKDVMWVQIRDSQFENLPKGVFEKFVNMEKIMIISSRGFKNLEQNYFDKKITLILMKNTDLEVIGEKSFVELENLKILSLNYNNVKKIHRSAFRDLVNLEKIEMVYNYLETLDDDIFANNVNLKLVLLYNNQLKAISGQLFSRNSNIESLQLQNNIITQIEKGFYKNMTKLTRIDLSSNLCISENIQLTRFIQWSSHQYKFKDCYNNFALMKSTNDMIRSVSKKIENLEDQVSEIMEKTSNDLAILEGNMKNSTALEEFKTNLLDFFKNDKEKFKQLYENDLHNITSSIRMELIEEVENQLESSLTKTQETEQQKLVSNEFNLFREEFSGKFVFIYFILFILVCYGFFSTYVIFIKLKIFPRFGSQLDDNRKLIEQET
ncbi:CLUMA_CG011500, isoform A [Clunio marinus]|uniref:CLUMA_CG011500, isoform A n=1 Tax=Clunio marinus TaxID=568069 RepID=A0A1J1IF01_9DIPT|nr:CLUMA_CG011500, isoform A [Clunio marinus]